MPIGDQVYSLLLLSFFFFSEKHRLGSGYGDMLLRENSWWVMTIGIYCLEQNECQVGIELVFV